MPNTTLSIDSRTDLGWSVTREIAEAGRVIIYTAQMPTREAIDALYADIAEYRQRIQGQPMIILYDFSHPKASLTPYAQAKSREQLANNPNNDSPYAGRV